MVKLADAADLESESRGPQQSLVVHPPVRHRIEHFVTGIVVEHRLPWLLSRLLSIRGPEAGRLHL